jgi:hypothetical protein
MPEDNPVDCLLDSALLEGNTDTSRPQVMIGAAASKNLMVLLAISSFRDSMPRGGAPAAASITEKPHMYDVR